MKRIPAPKNNQCEGPEERENSAFANHQAAQCGWWGEWGREQEEEVESRSGRGQTRSECALLQATDCPGLGEGAGGREGAKCMGSGWFLI